MKIYPYTQEITDELMELLLVADPDKTEILSYFSNAKTLIARDNGDIIGIGVMLVFGKCAELKNLSIQEKHQGKGVAKLLIKQLMAMGKKHGAEYMVVGTGNSSFAQLSLYQKCGFRMNTIIPNYFENYPQPIYENGIRCIDMVQLRIVL